MSARRERRASGRSWLPVAAALSLVVLVHPKAARGQSGPPAWGNELAFLSGNAALGGLTAALIQELRGGSFWDAFLGGALGGAVAYAGKRIAVDGFYGAGLIGRQVAGVGTSMVRNASDGRGALEQLVLPVGVARLYLRRDSTSALPVHAQVKLDVLTILTTAYLGLRENTDFDFSASISAGTPVFFTPEPWSERQRIASQVGGAIWLRNDPNAPRSDAELRGVLAHERVHVAQDDFTFLAWGDPVERSLTDRLPGGTWIDRHLDLGLHLGAWGVANWLIGYDQRPWEQEARFLSTVSRH